MRDGTLVIGVGSSHGDDRAGWLVVERLLQQEPAAAARSVNSPAAILDSLDGINELHVIDAVDGQSPGRWHCWNWPAGQLLQLRSTSSHAFDLPSTLGVAQTLNRLPARVFVHGIEGTNFSPAADMTTAVRQACEHFVMQFNETDWDARTISGGRSVTSG